MFERFTDRARRVVVLSQDHALLLNQTYIDSPLLVLGMVTEAESVAAMALTDGGVTAEAIKATIVQGDRSPSGYIPFTLNAKRALGLSLRESMQLGCNYIGPEHLLLGLIRGESCADMFDELGVDTVEIRRNVIERVKNIPAVAVEVHKKPPYPDEGIVAHLNEWNLATSRSGIAAPWTHALTGFDTDGNPVKVTFYGPLPEMVLGA